MDKKGIKQRMFSIGKLLNFRNSLNMELLLISQSQRVMLREEVGLNKVLSKKDILNAHVSIGPTVDAISRFFKGKNDSYFAEVLKQAYPEKFKTQTQKLEQVSRDLYKYIDEKNQLPSVKNLKASDTKELDEAWKQTKKIILELQDTLFSALHFLNTALGEEKTKTKLPHRIILGLSGGIEK